MKTQSEFIKSVKLILVGFQELTNQVTLAMDRLLEFARLFAEDAFVEKMGIARSDIRTLKFEDDKWVAYLHNRRKIYLDM